MTRFSYCQSADLPSFTKEISVIVPRLGTGTLIDTTVLLINILDNWQMHSLKLSQTSFQVITLSKFFAMYVLLDLTHILY